MTEDDKKKARCEVSKARWEWSNQDPRELINKRSNIVVWAPQGEVFRAGVETHQGWCIFLRDRGKDQRDLIGETDEWPTEWKWISAPA